MNTDGERASSRVRGGGRRRGMLNAWSGEACEAGPLDGAFAVARNHPMGEPRAWSNPAHDEGDAAFPVADQFRVTPSPAARAGWQCSGLSRIRLLGRSRRVRTVREMSLVTTKEAAQILGVTPVRVRQFIKDGRLVAEKRGRDHLLEDREVQRFKRHGRRSGPKGGRPPGSGTG